MRCSVRTDPWIPGGVAGSIGVALLALAVASPVVAEEPEVRFEQGRVTARFENTPVSAALAAFHRGTGLELVVPPSATARSITLTAQSLPLEAFLRQFLGALELGGYMLVYESDGKTARIQVVDRGTGPEPAPTEARGEEPAQAATPAAREPIYIPPAQPPVYIPPSQPPVYIPPAQPPVYIPPAQPPTYTPPPVPPTAPSQ